MTRRAGARRAHLVARAVRRHAVRTTARARARLDRFDEQLALEEATRPPIL